MNPGSVSRNVSLCLEWWYGAKPVDRDDIIKLLISPRAVLVTLRHSMVPSQLSQPSMQGKTKAKALNVCTSYPATIEDQRGSQLTITSYPNTQVSLSMIDVDTPHKFVLPYYAAQTVFIPRLASVLAWAPCCGWWVCYGSSVEATVASSRHTSQFRKVMLLVYRSRNRKLRLGDVP